MSDLTALNLEPGEVVGGYTLISRLGSGAMGSVWRVHDDGGQVYAMKILRDSLAEDGSADGMPGDAANAGAAGDPSSPARRPVQDPSLKENVTPRERLRREALALKKVNHPGVCGIVDMELDDALAFIVTELIEGRNLKDDVAANGKYVGDDLERLARKLMEAVKAVHAAGIVHRDIKPTNVMVSASGPVLVDFGIAMGEGESHVTRTGLVMGTPGFIAPEIIDGADSSEATDWWSVASVLAFAATGEPVFGTKPLMAVLEREASGNANLAGLPAHTLAAFRSALNPDPRRRCTPEQLLHAIALDALNPMNWDDPGFDDGTVAGNGATEVMHPFDGGPDAATTVFGPGDAPSSPNATTAMPATSVMPASSAETQPAPRTATGRAAWRDDGDDNIAATRALTPDQCTVTLPSDLLGPDEAAIPPLIPATAVNPNRTPRTATGRAASAREATAGGQSPLQRVADASNRTGASLPPAYVPTSSRDIPVVTPKPKGDVPEFLRQQPEATAVMPQNMQPPTQPAQPAQPQGYTQPPLEPMPPQYEPPRPQVVPPYDQQYPDQQYPGPYRNQPYGGPSQGAGAPQHQNTADARRGRYLEQSVAVLCLMAVVPAIAAVFHPLIGLATAAALMWLLFTIGYSAEAQIERESRRGGMRKGSDSALRVVQLPWHLLKGLFAALGRSVQFALIDLAGMIAAAAALQLPWAMVPLPDGVWPYELPWLTDGPLSPTGLALAGMAAIAWILTTLWPAGGMLRLGAGALRR
ncbi:protein kinase [Bifidobacterium stellenboschense]|uniref:non-specific serine/threonine protein kinase n=2 Tax=Bifidobacterium stellenboschense TaxID=762211 RepID=A0A087E0Y7_9BIFI|nr:protein kinase [Bifidobacterium stellenboschense]